MPHPLPAVFTMATALAATAFAATDPPSPTPSSPPTYVESITVTATTTSREIRETPGSVGVVGREQIESSGAADARGLLLFEPGVLVEGSPARLGLGGFNIRGIGGNRVATRIDGVQAPEQFSFGPLAITRAGLDVEALESVEILKSAGSALYGSDALGGVVSLVTRDPSDFLGTAARTVGGRLGWDSREDEVMASLAAAATGGRWSGSLSLQSRDGEAADNQGTVATEDGTRTAPGPRQPGSLGQGGPRRQRSVAAQARGRDVEQRDRG